MVVRWLSAWEAPLSVVEPVAGVEGYVGRTVDVVGDAGDGPVVAGDGAAVTVHAGRHDAVVAPMSLALGWGLALSTLVTLILVPTLYTIASDLRTAPLGSLRENLTLRLVPLRERDSRV